VKRGCHGRRGWSAQGESGEGRPSVGGGGKGWRPSRGKTGQKATTRVSLREKRSDTTDDSDLASNGPQPFSHIHTPKITFGNIYFGILHSTPLKKNSSSNSSTPNKTSKVPHIAPPFQNMGPLLVLINTRTSTSD
jgi:hypothetical protein